MGKQVLKLSRKAKKQKFDPKGKKKGSYRKIWISDSDAEQLGATGSQQNGSEDAGSQSDKISAVVPSRDKFPDTSDSD